ncbi:MAG TPA: type II secretion system major pseudopilin GspG [Burkholderiales bacterium]|nr:type II secretion system major pseudopilin GspG [Burkholderiales bacterium]
MSRASVVTPRSHAGFSLIEILIVVVIIGILASFVVVNVIGRDDDARVVAAKNDVSVLMSALAIYRLDNGVYPSSEQGLRSLIEKPTVGEAPRNWKPGGYVKKLPKDPWGVDYQYLNPGIRGEVDVVSFGADRRPGGDGYNADIGSWDTTVK